MTTRDEAYEDDARTVRPYTVTGGRTRSRDQALPLEALVRATGRGSGGPVPERRRIIALTAGQVLSVAELSAHLGLPLGVTRVLVGDLAAEGLLSVSGGARSTPSATDAKLLESVLHGISAL